MKRGLVFCVCAVLLLTGCATAAAESGFQLSGKITWNTSKKEIVTVMDRAPAVLNREEQSGVYAMYFSNQSVSRYDDADVLAFFLQEKLAGIAYEMLESDAGERYRYLLAALESKYGKSEKTDSEKAQELLLRVEEIGADLWKMENVAQWRLEDDTRILLFQTRGKVRLYYINEYLLTNGDKTYATDGL